MILALQYKVNRSNKMIKVAKEPILQIKLELRIVYNKV